MKLRAHPIIGFLPLILILAFAAFVTKVTESQAALAFKDCPGEEVFQCAELSTPLDYQGVIPGTVSLKVRRKLSNKTPTKSALLALAGGPGQDALSFGYSFIDQFAPALVTHDLLFFDQRGTGKSSPLHCKALDSAGDPDKTYAQLVSDCANQIGPKRKFFTTADSVEDIEAIRQASGYEKLFLAGVSYGTKVALDYASRYPEHVERLLLDSVVLQTVDFFQLSSFAGNRRVIQELCAQRACRGITADPVKDMAQVAQNVEKRKVVGTTSSVYDYPLRTRINNSDLLKLMFEGDFNPVLRAMIPAALHATTQGDY